jgi:hypothetical protein
VNTDKDHPHALTSTLSESSLSGPAPERMAAADGYINDHGIPAVSQPAGYNATAFGPGPPFEEKEIRDITGMSGNKETTISLIPHNPLNLPFYTCMPCEARSRATSQFSPSPP